MALPLTAAKAVRRAGVLPGGRQASVLVAGLATLAAGLVAATVYGAVFVSPSEVLAAIAGEAERVPRQIVWNLRVPRAVVAGLVGMNLAVAGALLQGAMRSPLAAPTVVGVTAGAGLAATVVLAAVPGLPFFLPLVAFFGAAAAMALVYVLSWQPSVGTSPVRMVLAGVAVTTMLGTFSLALMSIFSDRVQPVVLWMGGTLAGRSWDHAELIWPYSLVGLIGALALAGRLDVMRLGDQTARVLGVPAEATRIAAMAVAALLVASAVSVAGLVGFVGLIVPFLARSAGGHGQAYILAASAIGGASLMVWADLGARLVISPLEIPVGVITALIGGPLFVLMLYRMRYVGGAGA